MRLMIAAAVGIVILLVLIIKFKLHPVLSMMISAIIIGAGAGMPLTMISDTVEKGVGKTLQGIALLVGLGSMFGGILEVSGGAQRIAETLIANMIEIHANATPFDAGVYLSSCDKGVPGNLMGLARVNIPSVFVPGGTMNAGPEMLTLEQLGMYSAGFERGEIDEEKLDWAKCNACPSCGACSFIGTASAVAEAGW